VVLEVPLLLLERLCLVEERWVESRGERAAESAMERARAGNPPVFEEARLHRDVARHFRLALGDRAHAVPDLEADVPKHAKEALDELGARAVERVRQQDQHVDVRVRKELAAAVAADGDERGLARGTELVPSFRDHVVDEPRMLAQQPPRVRARLERNPQCRAARLQFGAPALRRVARRSDGHRRGEPVHRRQSARRRAAGAAACPGTSSALRSRCV